MDTENNAHTPDVRVVDVNIRFGSLVMLLVKLALAAIPALLILAVIGAFIAGLFTALGHHV